MLTNMTRCNNIDRFHDVANIWQNHIVNLHIFSTWCSLCLSFCITICLLTPSPFLSLFLYKTLPHPFTVFVFVFVSVFFFVLQFASSPLHLFYLCLCIRLCLTHPPSLSLSLSFSLYYDLPPHPSTFLYSEKCASLQPPHHPYKTSLKRWNNIILQDTNSPSMILNI